MDNTEVERALEDLDNRLERLRALYEQYFMGIEKLEPLVPRKDLDRRIMLLRREQVRNTALRFKFQTLIQRYNTFQQYWARVAREIDNGTYHRDVARAAARFGAKDALTILGKRQADKYARLIQNQEERRVRAKKASYTIDEDEVLDDADLLADEPEEMDELVADDELEITTAEPPPAAAKPAAPPPPPAAKPGAPPPPPTRGSIPPPPPAAGSRPGAPPPPPPARASIPPSPPPVAAKPGAPPPPPPPVAKAGAAPPPPPPPKPAAAPPPPPAPAPEPAAKPAEPARKPEPIKPIMMMRRAAEVPVAVKPPEAPSAPEHAAPAKQSTADPDAAKRRVAELAAQVKQSKAAAAGPTAARPLDLDLDLDAKSSPPSRRKPSSTRMRAVRPPSDDPAPSVPSPSSRRRGSRAMRAVSASNPPEPLKEAKPAENTPPAATPTPEPEERFVPNNRPAPRPRPSASEESLSDSRMRQIYAQYVEAKRAAKESTAGVTYEAMAKQLRQQAEKLKASHPHKSVDYNVVMKDGKPTLKPILR